MSTITQIKVGDSTYDICDTEARQHSIPSGGTLNQILKKASNDDYDAVWSNGAGSDWSDITNKPDSFPPSSHNHDDIYYTESEIDTALALKSDKSQDSHHSYLVKGTQLANTNNWTGNLPEVSSLYEGLIINYWLPFAGTQNSATLTLTLKDNVVTDPIPVYYQGSSRVTTQQVVNTIWQYVYQTITISGTSYTGFWAIRAHYQDTTYTYMTNLNIEGVGGYIADSTIYRYQLLFHISDDIFTPMNNDSNKTGTTKTMLTNVEFDPFGKIYYYGSTTTVNTGSTISGTNLYYVYKTVDLRYSFNYGTSDGLQGFKDTYLKVLMQSNGKCKIASERPLTQTLPQTNDGIYYIFLGRMASTTSSCFLFEDHPIYYHNGTSLRILSNPSSSTVMSYDSPNETLEIIF